MKGKKKFILILSSIFILVIFGLMSRLIDRRQGGNIIKENSQVIGYGEKYFDRNKIMEINIEIDENELENMFENAKDKKYKTANVTINGDTYNNIGVRTKGNSSLNAVVSNDESDRYSLKIKFDKYEDNQTMEGLTQLNLNNCYSDPSYMREFIAYSIFEDMGLKTPEFAYTKVSINGEYRGLYLAVESVLEPFIENNFEDSTGDLYKSTGTNGGTLTYNGDDIEKYEDLELKSDEEADSQKLINMISALNSGENIEEYLDVDTALKYIAINTAILNLDSYQGNFAHNYYLYEQDGKFTIIPWDLNMAFGGFEQGNSNKDDLIDINSPTMVSLEQRPLVNTLLSNEEYKAKYYGYLEEIVNKYLDSDYLENMTSEIYDLISTYVKEDPTAFYTFEEFETNIKTSIEDTQQNMGKGMQPPEGMEMQNQGGMEGMQPPERMEMPNKDGMEGMQLPEGMEIPNQGDMEGMQLPEGMEKPSEDNEMNGNIGKEKTLPGILELAEEMSESIKNQLSK